ncbi:hypothetical protein HDE78_002326 [Rhodanobacter sp. K2T2]|uniref:PepSY domain-containing protein n=1 Tax=Rhodanobacter sp. K2T2 TaxID=2723085 RepID=UPI0015CA2B82|nr:PepSY domain-containing protein [Rhodanobacter sp. K2T2]NYE29368.1 hypothetical protein [Rhodanobacter sp. K2T2]
MKILTGMCMAFAATLLWSGASLADQPGNGWLSAAAVTQKLDAQGFKHVQALEAVHGHWEGEAFQHGQLVKFHADAKTGQVTFEKAKDNARGNN